MGQSIYEQEQANAADAPAGDAEAADSAAEDDVVDAEFSEVDEDAKN